MAPTLPRVLDRVPPTTPPTVAPGDERFLVWRTGTLGNTVVAIPMILALRRAFPSCHLAVVVDRKGHELLLPYGEINELIVYDRRHGRPAIASSVRLALRLRAGRYSHSFHLKRFLRNALLARAAGIPRRYGFETRGRAPLLTRTMPYHEDRNIVLTCLSLLELLGVADPGATAYRYPVCHADAVAAATMMAACGAAGRRYALVHCGAVTHWARRVTPLGIRTVLDAIAGQLGLVPILMMGPADERAVADVLAIPGADLYPVWDARPYPVRVSIEALRRADLFVGQDSGPAHLAALAGTPEIVFHVERPGLGDHLAKWTPWQARCAICVVPESAPPETVLAAFTRGVETLRLGGLGAATPLL